MKNAFLNLFFSLLLCQTVHTQPKDIRISDSVFAKYATTAAIGFDPEKQYYVAILNQQHPTKVVRNLNGNTAIIEIASKREYDSLANYLQLKVANNNWKYSPALEKLFEKANVNDEKFILSGQNINDLLTALQSRADQVKILSTHPPSHSVIIQCSLAYLRQQLLSLNQIIFIDVSKTAHPETNIIGYDRSFHGINAVDYLLPGANGKGIVAGVKEQKMEETDIDLWKRVLPSPIEASTTSNHASVIASIIGGAGNISYEGRGIAWGCLFFPSSFANLFADDFFVLNANHVSVQNHSYGTVIQQFYGAEAVSYDELTWKIKTFVPVMSAGNQGNAFATEGQFANIPGFANLTGNFKMAKNVVTVGAIDNKENISALSSAGPVYDGRLSPQLIALGPSGTSDAAAIVSGTVAVMQQVYTDSTGALPLASLIKSVLYTTAEDIFRPGPDFKTGYGLLDSYAAVKAIQQKQFNGSVVNQGEKWTTSIAVPSNAAELKVTLAWTDSAAPVNNNQALINDLDLEVIDLNTGKAYQPWVLRTFPNSDSLNALPVRQRDSLNTAEQVSIPLPSPGSYQISVNATRVITPSLPFHIAYKIDTLQTFHFTNPLHASDLYAAVDDHVTIRWKTFVADSTETGKLLISYDKGNTWQVLQNDLKLISKKYNWTIKDTTAIAVLKMETAFGSFLSNEFLISRPTKIQVDYNCADSVRLSWNRTGLANAYRVYTLTDSPYLTPITVVRDNSIVLQQSLFPSHIFAVEPLLPSGIPAARSAVLKTDIQGVRCFYKTLNYNLLDHNQMNLLLELSTSEFIDSVIFEKVTSNGQLLEIYGRAKVIAPTLLYTQFVNEISSGITYLRGKILLSNGTVVYTDIVPVLTSGKRLIWFYPNPVHAGTTLQYERQQGIPTSSQLLFFDDTGRLLKKYASLPDKIDVSKFATGVLFYQLLSEENEPLETGKLLIIK